MDYSLYNQVHATYFGRSVETDTHGRDVILGEDYFICREGKRIRSIASILHTGLNLMRRHNTDNNFIAFREELNFDRQKAINCLEPA